MAPSHAVPRSSGTYVSADAAGSTRPSPDERPDQRGGERLGHRHQQVGVVRCHALRVPLVHDGTVVGDHERVRVRGLQRLGQAVRLPTEHGDQIVEIALTFRERSGRSVAAPDAGRTSQFAHMPEAPAVERAVDPVVAVHPVAAGGLGSDAGHGRLHRSSFAGVRSPLLTGHSGNRRVSKGTAMNWDVFITCAITGSGDTTHKSPHVPVTPAADRRLGHRGREGRRRGGAHPRARSGDRPGQPQDRLLRRGRRADPRRRRRRRGQPHRRNGRRPRARRRRGRPAAQPRRHRHGRAPPSASTT